MKKIILFSFVILAAVLSSCEKDQVVTRANEVPSPLSVQEFVFDNLTWTYWNSGSPAFDEIFITPPKDRPF